MTYENASTLVATNYKDLQRVNMYMNYGDDNPLLRTQGEAYAKVFNSNFSSMKTASWLMSSSSVLKYTSVAGMGLQILSATADILSAGSPADSIKTGVIDSFGLVGQAVGTAYGVYAAGLEEVGSIGIATPTAIATIAGSNYLGNQVGVGTGTLLWNGGAQVIHFFEKEKEEWTPSM